MRVRLVNERVGLYAFMLELNSSRYTLKWNNRLIPTPGLEEVVSFRRAHHEYVTLQDIYLPQFSLTVVAFTSHRPVKIRDAKLMTA